MMSPLFGIRAGKERNERGLKCVLVDGEHYRRKRNARSLGSVRAHDRLPGYRVRN